jgi:hypothetical protein
MQLLPSIRSLSDHDQLAIALMRREKEEEIAKQHATASQKGSTNPKSVLLPIKAGE